MGLDWIGVPSDLGRGRRVRFLAPLGSCADLTRCIACSRHCCCLFTMALRASIGAVRSGVRGRAVIVLGRGSYNSRRLGTPYYQRFRLLSRLLMRACRWLLHLPCLMRGACSCSPGAKRLLRLILLIAATVMTLAFKGRKHGLAWPQQRAATIHHVQAILLRLFLLKVRLWVT